MIGLSGGGSPRCISRRSLRNAFSAVVFSAPPRFPRRRGRSNSITRGRADGRRAGAHARASSRAGSRDAVRAGEEVCGRRDPISARNDLPVTADTLIVFAIGIRSTRVARRRVAAAIPRSAGWCPMAVTAGVRPSGRVFVENRVDVSARRLSRRVMNATCRRPSHSSMRTRRIFDEGDAQIANVAALAVTRPPSFQLAIFASISVPASRGDRSLVPDWARPRPSARQPHVRSLYLIASMRPSASSVGRPNIC